MIAHPLGLPRFMSYWGKARPLNGAACPYHPLAWHCLDVAASAMTIVRKHTILRRRLDKVAGVTIADLIPFLAALHDLGKFCTGFQRLAPEALCLLRPGNSQPATGYVPVPHADLGLALWRDLSRRLISHRSVSRRLEKFLYASFGHHGAPPELRDGALTYNASQHDREAAEAFVRAMADLLAPVSPFDDPRLREMPESRCGTTSFLIASIINVADWIGSDQNRFPYTPPHADLPAYWTHAQECAELAVSASGILPQRVARSVRFADLFPEIGEPRPLQQLADTLALPGGQTLILIEDATGSGKTEAADTLAARLMAEGRGSGIYLAMPTMVTADAMALRHVSIYRRLFDDAEPPSLTLVHGGVDDAVRAQLDQGGAECRAWLGSDRRLQLAAEVAVGTIDQALLAAMPSRFSAVRLFGLATKVLVVDEVHCHDDYTGTLLDGLLRLHAALGGSAVLLSATLSADRKQRLAQSFAEGAGWSGLAGVERLRSSAYPSMTIVSVSGITVEAAASHIETRSLPVILESSRESITETLLNQVRAGGCAAWLRGAVDDAIESYLALKERYDDVVLLHARFPRSRRRQLEAHVLGRFGRDANPALRSGGFVIATQILEQSLDLDFDHMAVDLKPIDAVIQSAGRLRRHRRDTGGWLLKEGSDTRPASPLLLHTPDPAAEVDAAWYTRLFPRAAAVYRRTDWLWLTAAVLRHAGAIVQPSGLRELVEGVFGVTPFLDVPPTLIEASQRAEGESLADRSAARFGTVVPGRGYSREGGSWADDLTIATRLGDAVEICLVRWDNAEPVPWVPEEGWSSGDLRLRTSLIAPLWPLLDVHPAVVRLREDGSTRSRFRYRLPVPLSADPNDSAIWRLDNAGGSATLLYRDDLGITIDRMSAPC